MDYLEKYSEEYEKNYSDHSFELVLIKIRRAKIIESLKRHNHDRILEIGCGLEPLFMFFSDFSSYTLVEPSPRFMENARKHADGKSKIHFVQDYLENAYEKLSGVSPGSTFPAGISRRSRTLPLTCTTSVTNSSTTSASLYSGHGC